MDRKSQKKNPSQKSLKNKTVLLCVSGSIAAYRACDLVRELKRRGANVVCLMTRAAERFVAPLTFKVLSGNPVHTDPFSGEENWAVLHTSLADRADLILIVPATADLIARLAAGFADDLVTSVALASQAKILVVPAMNDRMYAHPLTQENMAKLKSIGYEFVAPIEGDLVCGRTSIGHIESSDAVLAEVERLLSFKTRS